MRLNIMSSFVLVHLIFCTSRRSRAAYSASISSASGLREKTICDSRRRANSLWCCFSAKSHGVSRFSFSANRSASLSTSNWKQEDSLALEYVWYEQHSERNSHIQLYKYSWIKTHCVNVFSKNVSPALRVVAENYFCNIPTIVTIQTNNSQKHFFILTSLSLTSIKINLEKNEFKSQNLKLFYSNSSKSSLFYSYFLHLRCSHAETLPPYGYKHVMTW